MTRSRGQALVETAVAVTVFAVLLAAMPLLLVYHDMQRVTHGVARDASFLAGWERRGATAAVATLAKDTLSQLHWRHPADGGRIVAGGDDVDARTDDIAPPGRAATMLQFIAAPLREAGGFMDEGFALDPAGYRKVTIQLRVPPLRGAPDPFDSMTLPLQGDAALLTDAWNAAGPAQVAQRVSGLVPTRQLQNVQAPLGTVGGVLRLIEPAFAKFCPGLIEPDRLPELRLAASTSAVRGVVRDVHAERCR